MHILALSGSLRAASTNTELLRGFVRHAPENSAVELYEQMAALPLFNPDLEADTPEAVLDMAGKIDQCDGLVIASPEYAHGIPGALKNALDWLVSRFEIPEKPVMLVHASQRGYFVREHLREVLKTMSCRLYPGEEFEIHLIGQRPDEIRRRLDTPETAREIRDTLSGFSSFIGAAG